MAHSGTAAWPAGSALLAGIAKLAGRNIKLTVVLCVVLICGSFAAAAALQLRFDRVEALNQATYFETRRAGDIASVAAAALERYAALGRLYADSGTAPRTARNIAVFDSTGIPLSTLTGDASFVRLPTDVLKAARTNPVVIADSGLATIVFGYRDRIVAVSFDAATLVPASAMRSAMLSTTNGEIVTGEAASPSARVASEPVGGWPLRVTTAIDDDGALAAWYGSLPLYIFVILGPALVGAGLAALFVGEFERRARASGAIRALKSTRPGEARLLVRLAEAERQAVESQRSKAEFIAHMSHELRTPLNAIIGFSEVIERGFYGAVGHAKYVEYARDIGTAGRSLHAKIGDVLEFANLEAGRYPLSPIACDVSEIAGECVAEHVGRAFSRRVALDILPAAPVEALADPLAIKRIVTNLLANALAYTREGGRVRVEIWAEEGAAIVSVRDDGSGFTTRELETTGKAFRRFDRPGAPTGAGLGLAIAFMLARRMGGALRLAGLPGEGTHAELRLPVANRPQ
jgi:signal transduction histidine kinase